LNAVLAAEIITATVVFEKGEDDMNLGRRQIAELVAVVGVVVGVIALFTSVLPGVKYTNDGTILAALIILLALAACALAASLLLGKPELDLVAAVAGAVAFGLFLYIPSIVAFKHLSDLDAGAWLGVCAGLIPIGAGVAQLWHRRSNAKAPGVNLWTLGVVAGLVMIVIAVWSKVTDYGLTYWNASSSGHALGLLMLILVVASAVLIALALSSQKAELADLAEIVAAVLAGVAIAEGVGDAFGDFGILETGGWLALIGGLLLLASVILHRVVKVPGLK
jgi:hypothetical protein